MRARFALLAFLPLSLAASCSIVAGLGDFEPADEGSGAAGAGSPASSTGASSAQGGGGAGSSQGGAGSSQGGGGSGPGPGGSGSVGGAGPGGNGGTGGTPECNVPPCDVGAPCVNPSDCKTGVCEGQVCACNDHLVISELRSRGGPGGNPGNNDFIELYNPTGDFVTLADGEWTVEYRSSTGFTWTERWTSTGEIIGPYGHLLLANTGFSGAGVTPNHVYGQGIGDDAAVRLKYVATIIDQVCYCTIGCLPFAGYGCEGTPVVNPASDGSVSMERKGGGMSGSCIDTDDNSADFKQTAPSDPQNLASPATP